MPWVVGSAVAAAALVWTAGGGLRGAAAMLGAGLLLFVFVGSLAVARCPTCGSPLPRATAEPAAAGGEARGCARCAGQRPAS